MKRPFINLSSMYLTKLFFHQFFIQFLIFLHKSVGGACFFNVELFLAEFAVIAHADALAGNNSFPGFK